MDQILERLKLSQRQKKKQDPIKYCPQKQTVNKIMLRKKDRYNRMQEKKGITLSNNHQKQHKYMRYRTLRNDMGLFINKTGT